MLPLLQAAQLLMQHLARLPQHLFSWLTKHPEWAESLIPFLVVVIAFEAFWHWQFNYETIVRSLLLLALWIVIIFPAFRYGIRPAILVATLCNIYGIYAYAAPERKIETFMNLWSIEWLIVIILFGPAVIVGYLRERLNQLLNSERQARQLAEQEQIHLTTILQQLPVGVVIADAQNGILFGQQYLEQLLSDHDGNQSLPLDEWPLKQVLSGQVLDKQEFNYIHQGHSHVLRINGAPIFYQNRITAGVVVIEDITAERELEQRKDDFVSMVSHELKTPLTSLKMYLQLARKQHDSSVLTKAETQADKLNQLITDIQTQTRHLSDYRFEMAELNQLVMSIVEEMAGTVRHQLSLSLTDHAYALVDKQRFSQVVINLINNAVKYSPQAQQVIISVTSQEGQIAISVQDFGIGISKAEQQRIFERYYQSSHTSPGLGIGLYVSAEIIKQHGGSIKVESTPGQGSTFYIYLPQTTPPSFSPMATSITG